MRDDADYYASLPIFDGFASIMDPARYQPLPDDWVLGLTDVVSSTQAIEEGRYKAVNTAGASVIAAVSNALGGRKFPLVFGGDGASFAVSGQDEALARDALAATAAWTRDDLQLELRAGPGQREHELEIEWPAVREPAAMAEALHAHARKALQLK